VASATEILLLALRASYPPAAAWCDTTTIPSGNVTVPTAITRAWPSLGTVPQAGTCYTLKAWFGGVWGGQLLTFYADIGGTATSLCTVGAALGSLGDDVNGWAEIEVEIASASTCRLAVTGAITNDALNSGHLLSNSGTPLTCAPVTGVTFAAGDTLAIAVAFGSSASGQTIQAQGSRFTITGGP
jgi:hypothetical protein